MEWGSTGLGGVRWSAVECSELVWCGVGWGGVGWGRMGWIRVGVECSRVGRVVYCDVQHDTVWHGAARWGTGGR